MYAKKNGKTVIILIFTQILFTSVLFAQSITGFDSKFVNQSVPDRMSPSQKYNLIVTYQNSGSTVWRRGEVKLRLFSDQGTTQSVWSANDYEIKNEIEPGNTLSFLLDVTAPAEEGVYPFSTQLVKEGSYFGEAGKQIEITVTRDVIRSEGFNSAAFVEQTVPPSMDSGRSYKVMISFTNTGNTTWLDESYRLEMLDASGKPMGKANWRNLTIPLSEDIKPGASKVFNFDITPLMPGTYTLQWRMYSDRYGFFGDLTNPAVVKVNEVEVKKNKGKRGID